MAKPDDKIEKYPLPEMLDIEPVDVQAQLLSLERTLDPELVERVSNRYENLFNRTLRDQRDRATSILEEIACKHGFTDLAQFKQAVDLALAREFANEVGKVDAPDDQELEKLKTAIKLVMTKWEGACTAIDAIHRGTTSELLHRALEIEETAWRAEKAGELDKLTGLVRDQDAITKRFELERAHYLENGKRNEVMLWVEIDLDDFKLLNSRLSHATVDTYVLKPLAARLQSTIRSTDSACRFGGDEFSLLLNCVKRSNYYDVLRKIEDAIRQPFTTPDGNVSITASMGVLIIEKDQAVEIDTTSTDQFMGQVRKRADVAADYSKMQGKDRTTVYSDELKAFEESESVFVARFIRNNIRYLQQLRDEGLQEVADDAQRRFEQMARDMYTARMIKNK